MNNTRSLLLRDGSTQQTVGIRTKMWKPEAGLPGQEENALWGRWEGFLEKLI